MNNYYYGKSGKGDFRKEDLPENRWQLFWDTLRTRLSALFRLNLMYMVVWLPTMLVLLMTYMTSLSNLNTVIAAKEGTLKQQVEETAGQENAISYTDEEIARLAEVNPMDYLQGTLITTLLILIPCIAITGPATAGVSYVVRNWARDQHSFVLSDFWDAVKANWKQALAVSCISGALPFLVFVGTQFYADRASQAMIFVLPIALIALVGLLWSMATMIMYVMLVTYDLKLKDVIRNSILLTIGKLPFAVLFKLITLALPLLGFALIQLIPGSVSYVALALTLLYILFMLAFNKLVTASYANWLCETYLNPRIEGAQTNIGLRPENWDDTEYRPEDDDE